jgi:hypothetical protein
VRSSFAHVCDSHRFRGGVGDDSPPYGKPKLLDLFRQARVQDIDFARNEILVRDGKGAKDRITMLPASLKAPLQEHLKKVKQVHDRDIADGWGGVLMPDALDRKYPNAPKEWRWQWVFPQEKRWKLI